MKIARFGTKNRKETFLCPLQGRRGSDSFIPIHYSSPPQPPRIFNAPPNIQNFLRTPKNQNLLQIHQTSSSFFAIPSSHRSLRWPSSSSSSSSSFSSLPVAFVRHVYAQCAKLNIVCLSPSDFSAPPSHHPSLRQLNPLLACLMSVASSLLFRPCQ